MSEVGEYRHQEWQEGTNASESLCDDPEVYKKKCLVPARGWSNAETKEGAVESRYDHIWNGHGYELSTVLNVHSFEEALPVLVGIANNPSAIHYRGENGNRITISEDLRTVVVTRKDPFKRKSKKWKHIPETPPLPPIVVTAYTVDDPEYIENIMNTHPEVLL